MTRADRNARAEIVAAAYSLLSERGIEQTTIKEVARLAGVAPGLVHYYFASKDVLLQEVLQAAGQRYIDLIKQMMELRPKALAEEMFREPQTRVSVEPEWYRFRFELIAIGLHNEAVAPAARQMLAQGRECIAMMLERITGTRTGAEELSAVLMSCFDGLAIQKIIDPTFEIEPAFDALQRLTRAALK